MGKYTYDKNEATEIVVIADKSGSMSTIVNDAIGGFNSFLKSQQEAEGKANLTLVLFDSYVDVAVKSVPVKNVKPLTKETYIPRGSTALYDAIGSAISSLNENSPDKAIVCIITDGEENSSKKYTRDVIKDMIASAEKKGWQVHYLAANQDAFAVGLNLGSFRNSNFEFSSNGVKAAYANVSGQALSYRAK